MTAQALNAPPRANLPMMDPAGKSTRFDQIFVPHLNAAYNLSRWLTRNGPDAEDIVQQAYLRAFRSFETFQGQSVHEARAWLLAIVRNTCFTWLRKQGVELQTEFDEDRHSGAGDPVPDGESILVNRTALLSLQGCVEGLPAEFREVVVLRELEELSYKEISVIARVPVGTIMSRLARARKRLRECMEKAAK